MHKIFNFNSIPVPYRPKESVTVVTTNGPQVRDINPQYITNLEKVLENGSPSSLNNAVLSMAKECALDLVREMAFREQGWEAPIAVASWIPYNHVYMDKANGRIVLNVAQATHFYIDADGDRALVIPDDKEHPTNCALVKWPISMHPMNLKVIEKPTSFEEFSAFTASDCQTIIEENPVSQIGDNKILERELFFKKHREVAIGLMTNGWNNYDLYSSFVEGDDWIQKNERIFNSMIHPIFNKPQRALDLEENGMKTVRKDGVESDEPFILSSYFKDNIMGAGMTLQDQYAWALTSSNGIGTSKPRQMSWVTKTHLPSLVDKILNLEVSFRKVMGEPKAAPIPPFVEGNLLKRLKALGLINWIEIKHADPNMPPACIFWLQLPSGTPVAMTDVKRDDKSDNAHTFMVLLPPVFDNRTIYNRDGSVAIPASGKWEHPINHMQKVFTCFDSSLKFDGEVKGFWPKTAADMQDPKYGVKVSALFQALAEYCGTYGDSSPADKDPKTRVVHPTEMARYMIRHTCLIDYGRPMDHETMYEVAQKANKLGNICIVGSKSDDRTVRKYVLSNKMGGPFTDRKCVASPYRGATNRAQLQRALGNARYTVAVLKTSSLNQIFITPTGVEKQKTEKAFFRRVFNTLEAYKDHLLKCSLTTEQCPVEESEFRGWNSEVKKAWTISARHTIRIGKLVDLIGNKFMPLGMKQVFYKDPDFTDTLPIDLIMPLHELLDKNAHVAFLENAVEREIILPNGESVIGMVVERPFYRTGAASENIPPRWRRCAFKGIDSFPISWAVSKIKEISPRSVNFEFAEALQKARNAIMDAYGIVEEPEEG